MKAKGNFVVSKITTDMLGKRCFFPVDDMTIEDTDKFPLGEIIHGELRTIPDARKRSHKQHNLFMACCNIVAENTEDEFWSTKEKVVFQIKVLEQMFRWWTKYNNPKTGERMEHVEVESISFDRMDHLDACGFYDQGFKRCAEKLKMEVDEIIKVAKSQMKGVI